MSDCYVGRKKCGCAVAAIVIDSHLRDAAAEKKWQREVAKTVAEWICDGLSIERAAVEAVRGGLLQDCPHKPPKVEQPQLLLG